MRKGIEKLKQAWEDNPIGVIIVATAAAAVAAKLLDASTARANARTWSREVDRRSMMKMR